MKLQQVKIGNQGYNLIIIIPFFRTVHSSPENKAPTSFDICNSRRVTWDECVFSLQRRKLCWTNSFIFPHKILVSFEGSKWDHHFNLHSIHNPQSNLHACFLSLSPVTFVGTSSSIQIENATYLLHRLSTAIEQLLSNSTLQKCLSLLEPKYTSALYAAWKICGGKYGL